MSKQRKQYIFAIAVSLVTFAVYLPTLRNEFVFWDDDMYIYENIHIRSLSLRFILWAFVDVSSSNWHPLTWFSHAIDYAFWGLNPAGHHLTSIVIHALNTFIVVILVVRLLEAARTPYLPPYQESTSHVPPYQETTPPIPPLTRGEMGGGLDDRHILVAACVTGLLFGLHPLHVESVAWVSERKDLLCALFYLLSILFYLRYAEQKISPGPSFPKRGVPPFEKGRLGGILNVRQETGAPLYRFIGNRYYLLSFLLFVLALMSKPMAVSLPLVLLVLDWHPFKRIGSLKDLKNAAIEKAPYFAASLTIAFVTMIAQRGGGAMELMEELKFLTRILIAAKAIVAYLGKMVLPLDLSPYYPYPRAVTYLSAGNILAVVLVVCITVWTISAARKNKLWFAAWSYYLVTLLPVLGIVQVGGQAMADRYTYLPSLAPFLLIGLFASRGVQKADGHLANRWPAKTILAAAAGVLFTGLVVLTVKQISIWNNTITLWSYVIERDPVHIPFAYIRRGRASKEMKRYGDALADFTKAIELYHKSYRAYNDRGLTFKELGRFDQALSDLTVAISIDAKPFLAYSNRGVVFAVMGQSDHAMADFTKAISINPEIVDAYVGRGLLFVNEGAFGPAVADLTRALELNPYSADAYLNRGLAYTGMNELDRAKDDYDKALGLNPLDSLGYENRGIVFRKMGRMEKAMEDFSQAIALSPNSDEAYLGRGDLYRDIGNRELARRDYQSACDLGNTNGCKALRLILK